MSAVAAHVGSGQVSFGLPSNAPESIAAHLRNIVGNSVSCVDTSAWSFEARRRLHQDPTTGAVSEAELVKALGHVSERDRAQLAADLDATDGSPAQKAVLKARNFGLAAGAIGESCVVGMLISTGAIVAGLALYVGAAATASLPLIPGVLGAFGALVIGGGFLGVVAFGVATLAGMAGGILSLLAAAPGLRFLVKKSLDKFDADISKDLESQVPLQ